MKHRRLQVLHNSGAADAAVAAHLASAPATALSCAVKLSGAQVHMTVDPADAPELATGPERDAFAAACAVLHAQRAGAAADGMPAGAMLCALHPVAHRVLYLGSASIDVDASCPVAEGCGLTLKTWVVPLVRGC